MTIVRRLALIFAVGALAACGAGDAPENDREAETASQAKPEGLVVRGQLYYLERIALTPDSLAVVEVRDGQGPGAQLLAESREELGNRQVPIGFELQIDPEAVEASDALVLQAGIVSSPGPLRVTEPVTIEQRSGELEVGQLRLSPVPQIAFGVTYQCAERSVVVGALGEQDWLVVDNEVYALSAQPAASGARYVAVDDSDTEFWSKGDEATVRVRGERLPTCDRVVAPELPFTARGQEPGWHLRIDEEAIVLRAHYGEQDLTFPPAPAQISAADFRYETESEDHRLTVLVDRQACSDTMADLVYPYRVRYTLDGVAELGCGGDPAEVLMGGEWQIEQIGDEPVVAGTEPTIEFRFEDGEARFAGRASCNRYMGGFNLTGEGLELTPAASTLMACPDEAQALQERRLQALLGEVYGFGIDDSGRLLLRTSGGDIVAAH
ncbi:META domain-containing protein [Wenzhouxiangella limi]|uniref:META domain-containing protein n=1 Tax=Wenzhouxiangella limi TaxID=2707351 RepID=A0A845V2Q4_9GAMM|nr:META domain-containing protein [Wenzhouxiangella limi]NDY95526.1 META domain-containing protein [Wenzhouxiangella limi]